VTDLVVGDTGADGGPWVVAEEMYLEALRDPGPHEVTDDGTGAGRGALERLVGVPAPPVHPHQLQEPRP